MSDNAQPKVTRRKVSDYTPDHKNANRGTERGQYMIDRSVESVGLARSIVAAADGTIPAGNKTLQAALDAGIENVLEVETDGKTLIVVKRSDWDTVDSEQARRYAYLDNRAGQVGLDWDIKQLLADVDAGVDLGDMFHDWELKVMCADPELFHDAPGDHWQGMPEFEQDQVDVFHTVKVHFKTAADLQSFTGLVGQTVTDKTTCIYYPKQQREDLKQHRVVDEP